MTMTFSSPSVVPEVVNTRQSQFSVDVLCYCKRTQQHTVGWYEYNTEKWHFLCREDFKAFKWRYFDAKTDKYE